MSQSAERVTGVLSLRIGGTERIITAEQLQDADFIAKVRAEASEAGVSSSRYKKFGDCKAARTMTSMPSA